jgi:tetratricopeptide (TPR) repeat protein
MTALLATAVRAQQAPDGVFARARRLVEGGNGAAGRLLIDSVMSATPPESPTYAEALYWRASLAASNTDAERDYRKLIVEYPLSNRVGESLLRLADLESARGDRASATTHLQQFLADNPKSDSRPRATLLLVRLLFEQGELPRGCSTLKQTLADLPEGSVEVRNQLEYYLPRCTATDAGRGGAMPMTSADSAANDTAATEKAAKGKYTLQVAAYKTKAEAEALAKKLKARKFADVRVVGTTKLFRVRIGRYATHAAAVAAQKQLKAKKLDAFVTDIGPDDK